MAKRLRNDSISSLDPTSNIDDQPAAAQRLPAHTPKILSLQSSEPDRSAMHCHLPPHDPLSFASYADYEVHYSQAHTNRCMECRKNFPTAHFLDLHIAEHHDPIVAARLDRGEKVFACFVEGCKKRCSDWKKRRSHLVDMHGFPKNYDFLVITTGIDGKRSMLRPGVDEGGHRKSSRERERRGSSATATTETTGITSVSSEAEDSSTAKDVEEPSPIAVTSTDRGIGDENTNMEDLTKDVSSLQFVPRSVTFGRRKGKSGFAKK